MHTLNGRLSGSRSGALVGAATVTAAPLLNDLQANLNKTLKQTGASDEVADGIAQGISTLTAAGIGASVEMASGNGLAGTIVGGGTASATSDFLKGGGGQAAYFAPNSRSALDWLWWRS